MATTTSIIQLRRGAYADFDPQKMKPGEIAVITSGDPVATDGRAIYMAFAAGQVKRLSTTDDIYDVIYNQTEEIAQQIQDDVADDVQRAEDAADSIEASAQQIATNTADIADIKEDFSQITEGTNPSNMADINDVEIGRAWNGGVNANRAVLYIPVEPSTEYTLSFDSISGFDGVYWFEKASRDATSLLVDHQLTGTTETRTTTANTAYFVAQFNKNNIAKSDFDNINIRFVKTGDVSTLTAVDRKARADLTLLEDEIPNTVQTYTFTNGAVSQVTHSRNNTAIRTDAFTYGANTITEVRTLNTGASLTIVTNLTTLETTVTYAAA